MVMRKHKTSGCPKRPEEDQKCTNYEKDHPANSLACEKYLEKIKVMHKRKISQKPPLNLPNKLITSLPHNQCSILGQDVDYLFPATEPSNTDFHLFRKGLLVKGHPNKPSVVCSELHRAAPSSFRAASELHLPLAVQHSRIRWHQKRRPQ